MEYYINKIKDKLQAGLRKKVKYFYVGDPMVIPQEILVQGVITITPVTNSVDVADTGTDRDSMQIKIQVMKDLRQDYNKQPQEVVTTGWLMDIVEGRNSTGALKSDTIRKILRDNLVTIGIVSDLEIGYDTEDRGEQQIRVGTVQFNLTDLTSR